MTQLHFTHPAVFREFPKGNFNAQRSNSKFSKIGIDQTHEQINVIIGVIDAPAFPFFHTQCGYYTTLFGL